MRFFRKIETGAAEQMARFAEEYCCAGGLGHKKAFVTNPIETFKGDGWTLNQVSAILVAGAVGAAAGAILLHLRRR